MKRAIMSVPQATRRGTVLLIMLGISMLLIGLTFSLGLKVKSSIDDTSVMTKHAQAFLMAQAAAMRIYMSASATTSSLSYSSPVSGEGTITYSGTQGWVVGGQITSSLATTYPLANKVGWYLADMSDVNNFRVCAAGGSSQAKTVASKRVPYDAEVYYFFEKSKGAPLPTLPVATNTMVQVAPSTLTSLSSSYWSTNWSSSWPTGATMSYTGSRSSTPPTWP